MAAGKALELSGDLALAAELLCLAYTRTGNTEKGMEYFDRAVALGFDSEKLQKRIHGIDQQQTASSKHPCKEY